MKLLSKHACHGGELGVYSHQAKTTSCAMGFTVFMPPQALKKNAPKSVQKQGVLYFLAGLTCTEDNFTAKAGAYKMAAQLGLIIVCPDTSPRGDDVPDEEGWDFGKGAGFYVDATEAPWAKNYQMYSYISAELPDLIAENFPINPDAQGIFGHSMGGHGALTIYLKNQDRFKSVSAFAPIVSPLECPWGHKALSKYIGEDRMRWAEYDACALMRAGGNASARPEILIDQGLGDSFLEEQLKPELFEAACAEVGQKLNLRRPAGYDHGYFFIQSFVEDHLKHHEDILNRVS
jgi:S-formylglutathione hydrolase